MKDICIWNNNRLHRTPYTHPWKRQWVVLQVGRCLNQWNILRKGNRLTNISFSLLDERKCQVKETEIEWSTNEVHGSEFWTNLILFWSYQTSEHYFLHSNNWRLAFYLNLDKTFSIRLHRSSNLIAESSILFSNNSYFLKKSTWKFIICSIITINWLMSDLEWRYTLTFDVYCSCSLFHLKLNELSFNVFNSLIKNCVSRLRFTLNYREFRNDDILLSHWWVNTL